MRSVRKAKMGIGGINESLSLAIYYDEHLYQLLSLACLELFHGLEEYFSRASKHELLRRPSCIFQFRFW